MPTLHIHIHQVAFEREEEKSVPQKENETDEYTKMISEIEIYVFILLALSIIIYCNRKTTKEVEKL